MGSRGQTRPEVSREPLCVPGADANWSGDRISEEVTIFLVFSAPEAVLMVFSSKLLTWNTNRASSAQHVGTSFSALSSLRALCLLGEEQLETAFTHGEFLPGNIAWEVVD
jgi:hypothetical protein